MDDNSLHDAELTDATDDVFYELLDQVSERLQAHEPLDWEAIKRDYPAHIGRLKRILPAVAAINDLGQSGDLGRQKDAKLSDSASGELGTLGDFRIVREIGRGGMGVVYEAEQMSLERRVALKVLPFAAMLDERQLRRFRNEARAAALLRHPHIVGVHSVGCERGVHHYAMDLIDGKSVAQLLTELRQVETEGIRQNADTLESKVCDPKSAVRCDTTTPLAFLSTQHSAHQREFYRSAARLGAQAAKALHYAHQEGVIHRDIKPSNLLLDESGKLWITDFGLAHMLGDHSLTMTGDVLGTLRYMSPEQSRGVRSIVDHRTDVYSLGVTLYELLTLRPAFGGDDRQKLLREIGEAEPPAPRKINSAIPKDLETIVLKAIAKEAHNRYGTAGELAEDLQRFLENEPIRARRTGRLNHLWRWAKRKPAVAALTAAVMTLLLFLAIGGPLVAFKQAVLIRESHRQNYIMAINAAHQAFKEGNPKRMRELLAQQRRGDDDLCGFEWHYLWALCEPDSTTPTLRQGRSVWSVAFSPDGEFLATACQDGKIRIWDQSTHRIVRTLAGHSDKLLCVRFSPDGQRLASGSRDMTVRLWDPFTGQMISTLTSHTGEVTSVAFSSDGRLLASGSEDTTVRLWDVATGAENPIPQRHRRTVLCVAFSPVEAILASAGSDRDIMLWDVCKGSSRGVLTGHKQRVTALAYSGDGKTLASGGWGVAVKLWDVATCEAMGELATSGTLVTSLAFSPDNQTLAVGGENNSVTLWDLGTRKPVATIRGHRGGVEDVAFSVDGQFVASASGDSTVKLWKVARYIRDRQYVEEDWHTSVAFAARNNVLASASGEWGTPLQQSLGEIQLWDVAGADKRTLVSDETHWLSVTLSPDKRTLAAGGVRYDGDERSGVFGLWNVVSGKQLCRFYGEGEAVWSVAFSPDGEQVATGAAPQGVRLRNAATGELVFVLDASFSAVSVAYSPVDGCYLAAGGGNWGSGVSKLWDTSTGREVGTLGGHKNLVLAVAFSPDGRTLAAGDSHGDIKLWDIATHRELHLLHGQTGMVTSVAFSPPDGKTLASGRMDRTVKLWHVDTGVELMTLDAGVPVGSLAFSPDGKTLAAGCGDRSVTLWHATTERQNWPASLR